MSGLLKGRKLIFYDFEVLSRLKLDNGMSYWSVVFIEKESNRGKIIKNDVDELTRFFNANKDNIFIGYNCRGYDQFIFKGIMMGMDAGFISDQIIVANKKGHEVVNGAYRIPMNNFDIMPNPPIGLKTMEAFMGSMIKESDVPFDIDRPLTTEEENDLLKYNIHDVKETMKVFEHLRHEFDSQLQMIEAFELSFTQFNKTKAQLSAHILKATKQSDRGDEFEYRYPDTLQLGKYEYVKEWFDNNKFYKTPDGKKNQLLTEVAGVPTVFGFGGIHSSLNNIIEEGIILCADIASMYPALIIEYELMSRNVEGGVKRYKEIRDTRLKYKAEKNPMQQPLKILLNATFGTFKDEYNPMFDKLMSNSICIAGQLLLTDLVDKIEPYCKVLQKNTDGLFMKVDNMENVAKIKEIASEWEKRTRLDLEWDIFKKIVQKDVNNYILVPDGDLYDSKGKPKWKAKGAFVKILSPIDYELPIVNKAITQYFLDETPVEETINNCNELIEFQTIAKFSNKYDKSLYGCTFSKQPVLNEKTGKVTKKMMWNGDGEVLKDRTFRVFASLREEDKGIFKMKNGSNPAKYSNTSEKVFIDNGDIVGKKCPDYLDKEFYIDLAKNRINQFLGIKNKPKKK